MSAMDTMMQGMLSKLIPAEVLAMLAPEKLQEFGNQANAFLNAQREFQEIVLIKLDAISTKQVELETMLDSLIAVTERTTENDNGCDNGSGEQPARPRRKSGSKPALTVAD